MVAADSDLNKKYKTTLDLGIKQIQKTARNDPQLADMIIDLFNHKLYPNHLLSGPFSRANLESRLLVYTNIQFQADTTEVSSLHRYIGDTVDYVKEQYRRAKRTPKKKNSPITSIVSTPMRHPYSRIYPCNIFSLPSHQFHCIYIAQYCTTIPRCPQLPHPDSNVAISRSNLARSSHHSTSNIGTSERQFS